MDQEHIGAAVVGVAALSFLVLYVTNTVPFCTQNWERTAEHRVTNGTEQRELRQQFDAADRTVIKTVPRDAPVADLGPVVAYYLPDRDVFYVVWEGTIAGDQIYGPFDGRPRTCQFYPERFDVG